MPLITVKKVAELINSKISFGSNERYATIPSTDPQGLHCFTPFTGLPQVCPGHVKDGFITTITSRTKVKQMLRRVLGEESGPLHLTLTPATNRMGVELRGSIGLHPLEQQSLLWGSHICLVVVSEAMGLSSASGGHILKPMSLASIRFLEEGDNGPREVLPLGRGESLRAGLVELTDLLVEFVVHFFFAGWTDVVLDVVAVVPLIPDKVVEADKQAFDPSLGRLPTPQRVAVALLDLAPLFGQEAFKEILPADK